MLVNVFRGGKKQVFHVNASHILCVSQSDGDYHMQLMTSNNYVAYLIDRESYERVIDWMERQEDAAMLQAAIAADDGIQYPMAKVMETFGGAQ